MIVIIMTLSMSACELTPEYKISFNSMGGSQIDSVRITKGEFYEPTEVPFMEGYIFVGWYLDENYETLYTSDIVILSDFTVYAKWSVDPEPLIAADIAAYQEDMYASKYQLNLPQNGAVNNSSIYWIISSDYIMNNGIILPLNANDVNRVEYITGIFSLDGLAVTASFEVLLTKLVEVEISTSRAVDYTSLTSEYDLPDQQLTLYFEEDGYVPYVKVSDFFALLDTGFIDESYTLQFTEGVNTLEIYYQYYDTEYDEIYDLYCTINADLNTISTNDPGFYWAYITSTETNYGRHIIYDADHVDNYFEEDKNVVYDLSAYNMDITTVDGDVVAPYYVVNQLFAGSSYFNVYYNYDHLYGIYALPGADSDTYEVIKTSSMNNRSIPADLAVHTFSMLAFDLDYFYGLKDLRGIDTYDDLLHDYVMDLVSTNARLVDQTINDIIIDDMDDLHTNYGYPSYFNPLDYEVTTSNYLSDYGPRFQSFYVDGLWAVDDAISAKWGIQPTNSWAANSDLRPHYWFLDDQTAMLSLDDFNTSDIKESSFYDNSIAAEILKTEVVSAILPDIEGGSKFFFYNWSNEDNRLLEVLAKEIDSSYVDTYRSALLALGYTLVTGTSSDPLKANGYYRKTVGDFTYMVQVNYDEELNIFYVAVADEVPEIYDDPWMLVPDVFGTVYADSAVYMEIMVEKMVAEQPGLINIILDLTWNTGGNIGALYRVVGLITDQSFSTTSYNRATDSASRTYVTTEGLPDYSHLNWSLLISKVTFSAANEMATIFMENNLGPIIGVQSGGGASSITPILLPNGTAFTMSSNSINGYFTGEGTELDPYVFVANEFGITPDFAIATEDLFDTAILTAILYGS